MDVLGQLSNLKNLADGPEEPNYETHTTTLYVQNQRRLKPEQIRELVDAYKRGARTAQLTREYSIHRTTVWKHLDRAGVIRRPATRKLNEGQVKQAAELYQQGMSLVSVAKGLDVDAETARREFIKAGVARR